ncbi:MAG: HupE/UreJ family protein [Gemmatimonadaceae bacterium]|nr:HupE/UreJ family protein [Gemmatimonadaceae bacterium]
MSEALLYMRLGFSHIADLAGYDHILFVAALSIPYALRDWRKLLVLVTAFTVGHSITLALATLRLVSVSSAVVEALIPATILVTALLAWPSLGASTCDTPTPDAPRVSAPRYVMATFFGLIHGLGFSTYLRSLLGEEENIAGPLLAFNIGLEIGQLVILSVVLGIAFAVGRNDSAQLWWKRVLVVTIAALATMLLAQRI